MFILFYVIFQRCGPAGITSATEAVNTFTIRHPSVEISTTSVSNHYHIYHVLNTL